MKMQHDVRFQRTWLRFEQYHAAVFDHYCVAQPEISSGSAGWDYWEISGKTLAAAEVVFQQAMDEFEGILTCPTEAWLPNLLVGNCDGNEN
jgi:hypothetical protein